MLCTSPRIGSHQLALISWAEPPLGRMLRLPLSMPASRSISLGADIPLTALDAMDPTTLAPLSGHAIQILLLQLAGLLALARGLSELMRRLRQPAVLGELLAGIVLGPTILGHYLPQLQTTVFPPTTRQFHLLETVSWLGMVLLLLLTGIETDVRTMRSIGGTAVKVSVGGMLVNFALGGVMGWMMPAVFLTDPANRPIFAAFLATALAITAMPVVAKILIDLGLIRRNIGVVILSAGVLDDTTGWLVLSVIAGIAAAGAFSASKLAITLLGLAVYVLAMRYLIYPFFTRFLHYVNERVQLAGADVTLILVFTFLSAATTELIGVHAVFGAFVMGLLVRQVPRVRATSLHALETFVLSALSPVFFAFVGLKVDLWALSGWQLPSVVIGAAVLAKLVGCYTGGRLGGLDNWQSLAVGIGMNARGAMGLVVALIGLSLGLLTSEMYSTIVLLAIVTTFLAPIFLRLVLPKLPLTDDERRRLEGDSRTRLLPSGPLRVLVPTAAGPNAEAVLAIGAPLVRARGGGLTTLYVERVQRMRFRDRLLGTRSPLAGRGLAEHLARAAERLGDQRKLLNVQHVRAVQPAAEVVAESRRDYDMLMIGAAPHHVVATSLVAQVLSEIQLPAVIVRAGQMTAPPECFGRLLVPLDGSLFSRAAVEFAFAYGAATNAHVTLLHVLNEARVSSGALFAPEQRETHALRGAVEHELEAHIRQDFGTLAGASGVSYDVRILASGDPAGAIIESTRTDNVDLLVLGAENKMLGRPLFLGQGTTGIVESAECTVAVVVPYIGQLP
jgi:Kef-type K+ transport system membrane component KefB/nucleotide-binding universal stress UspA family protein